VIHPASVLVSAQTSMNTGNKAGTENEPTWASICAEQIRRMMRMGDKKTLTQF